MNITKNPHLQIPGAEGNLLAGSKGGVDAIAAQLSLNPEELKLLEQQSLANNVDFNEVLKASEKGLDPQSVIELLAQKGETKNGESVSEKITALNELKSGTSNKQTIAGEINELESQQAILTDSQKKNLAVLEKRKLTDAKRKSIFVQPKVDQMLPQKRAIHQQRSMFDLSKPQLNEQQKLSSAILENNKVQKSAQNLVNFNQFLNNQSPQMNKLAKNAIAKNSYTPINESLFNAKIKESLPQTIAQVDSTPSRSLQDIIYGVNLDGSELDQNQQFSQAMDASPKALATGEKAATNKVLDLSNVQHVNNSEELINKVQDYIIQTKVGKNPQVQMSFNHDDLGQVDLIVNKLNDQINVSIQAQTHQGKEFFGKNQVELIRNLNQSGVQIAEFKIESNTSNSQLSDFSGKNQDQSGFNSRGQHQSESGQRQEDMKRREQLWESYKEKEVA